MRFLACIFVGLLMATAALADPQVAQLSTPTSVVLVPSGVTPATDWAPIIIAIGSLVASLGAAIASIIAATRVGMVQTHVDEIKTTAIASSVKTDVIGSAVAAVQGKLQQVELNTNSITQRLEAASRSEGVAVGTAIGRKEVAAETAAEAQGKT